MKTMIWIAAGVCVTAMAWKIAPDLWRYMKISTM
jgi:hypothetical protein